ncbi:unnamed protein product [Ranitomeya imitator]|uniref:Uncharacterized protein n=1 Tax=Ranitomeya imitator TaxID=111125 RepID=A0ABN9MN18_9NEOB|nr:unnamed protein product [Ranitomeya imitator]
MTHVKTLMSVLKSQKSVPWEHAATLLAASSVFAQRALCFPLLERDAEMLELDYATLSLKKDNVPHPRLKITRKLNVAVLLKQLDGDLRVKSAQWKEMRVSKKSVHMDLAMKLDQVGNDLIWMNAWIQINARMGFVLTQMAPTGVNVPLAMSSQGKNVWISIMEWVQKRSKTAQKK